MASLLKLISISSTFQNPLTLPASEKKRVSGELKEVAESIRKVVDRFKAGKNGQGDASTPLLLGLDYVSSIPQLLQQFKIFPDSVVSVVSYFLTTMSTQGRALTKVFEDGVVEYVKRVVAERLKLLGGEEYSISVVEEPDWGLVCFVTLKEDARRALEVNLELQRSLPGIPVVVKWTGAMDVSGDELAGYIVEIARAGGFKARAQPGFNAVEAVGEVRGE